MHRLELAAQTEFMYGGGFIEEDDEDAVDDEQV